MTARSRKAPKTAESAPTPVADLGCWFLGSDDEIDLTLPGGDHTVTVKPELEAGESAELLSGIEDESNLAAGFEVYRLRKVAMYLVDWSLPKSIRGMDLEKRFAMLRGEDPDMKLRASAFTRIYDAIVAHEKAQPKALDIIPVDVVLSDTWFLAPDDAMRLALPGGESMVVRAELDAGAQAKLMAGLHVRANGNTSRLELALARASAYITEWSLCYPNGKPAPVGMDSMRAMRSDRFGLVRRTIEAYEKTLEARAVNPTGASS